MLRSTVALGIASSFLLASPALAQATGIYITHPLRGGAYWVEGGEANTGFIVGDKTVIAYDPEMTADMAHHMLAEIAKVTSKPVKTVIVSHADPDHVGGLVAFPAGTAIIEQENTRSEIAVSADDPNAPPPFGQMYKDVLATRQPTHVVSSTETATIDGVKIVLMYVGPAHTSGDLVAYLPAQKIVFGADLLTTNTGPYPIIHLGGSTLGWIGYIKVLLALDADTYVTGHGHIMTKAELEAQLHAVEQRRAQIRAMVYQGKTLEQIKAALPEPGALPRFPTLAQTVYRELTEGYPRASPPWSNKP